MFSAAAASLERPEGSWTGGTEEGASLLRCRSCKQKHDAAANAQHKGSVALSLVYCEIMQYNLQEMQTAVMHTDQAVQLKGGAAAMEQADETYLPSQDGVVYCNNATDAATV